MLDDLISHGTAGRSAPRFPAPSIDVCTECAEQYATEEINMSGLRMRCVAGKATPAGSAVDVKSPSKIKVGSFTGADQDYRIDDGATEIPAAISFNGSATASKGGFGGSLGFSYTPGYKTVNQLTSTTLKLTSSKHYNVPKQATPVLIQAVPLVTYYNVQIVCPNMKDAPKSMVVGLPVSMVWTYDAGRGPVEINDA